MFTQNTKRKQYKIKLIALFISFTFFLYKPIYYCMLFDTNLQESINDFISMNTVLNFFVNLLHL